MWPLNSSIALGSRVLLPWLSRRRLAHLIALRWLLPEAEEPDV